MQLIAIFQGRNRDFRAWLAAGMPANVVCMEVYRKKKTARKRPKRKPATSIIPNEIA